MSPFHYQEALRARGFVMESGGRWHGPFGITQTNTWNTITTTSLADRARDDQIQRIDAELAAKRRDFNAK
jgi:hypothetical protein